MLAKYAIIILAAGSSSRLGQAKQLIKYKKETLLNRVLNIARSIKGTELYVILGSRAEEIFLSVQNANCFINQNWDKGMGNSMAFAMMAVPVKSYDGVIFLTTDQPFLSKSVLDNLIKKHQETQKGIVISTYQNGQGIPSLFSRRYFDEISELKGDGGAKVICKKNINDLTSIKFLKGDFDIDTPDDLRQLNKISSK